VAAACSFLLDFRDKRDGASREGSGRVSVLKMTGLIRSYTLECNYNTGRIVNHLPNRPVSFGFSDPTPRSTIHPPKYTPAIFEAVLILVIYIFISVFEEYCLISYENYFIDWTSYW